MLLTKKLRTLYFALMVLLGISFECVNAEEEICYNEDLGYDDVLPGCSDVQQFEFTTPKEYSSMTCVLRCDSTRSVSSLFNMYLSFEGDSGSAGSLLAQYVCFGGAVYPLTAETSDGQPHRAKVWGLGFCYSEFTIECSCEGAASVVTPNPPPQPTPGGDPTPGGGGDPAPSFLQTYVPTLLVDPEDATVAPSTKTVAEAKATTSAPTEVATLEDVETVAPSEKTKPLDVVDIEETAAPVEDEEVEEVEDEVTEVKLNPQAETTEVEETKTVEEQKEHDPAQSRGGDISPGGGGACFSESASVQVKGIGRVEMKDLNVGQHVFAGYKDLSPIYKPIYGFGHRKEGGLADYLVISTNRTGYKLEITESHLIYVVGQSEPVSAGTLSAGDVLLYQSPEDLATAQVVVTKIENVKRQGLYQPLTEDGTLIVDGIHVSAYVSVGHIAPRVVDILAARFKISEQAMFHTYMAPYRFVCTKVAPQLCVDDFDVNEGIIYWLIFGRSIITLGQTMPTWMTCIGAALVLLFCGIFRVVEELLDGYVWAWLFVGIFLAAATWYEGSSQERKGQRVD